MEHPRARNDAIERLLREAQGASDGSATDPCPAPEEVAAWLDGGLSAADTARLEAHAASCPDCQVLVAALARTLPPEQAHAWASVRWAVPMAAAAVLVVGLWLTQPGQPDVTGGPPATRTAQVEAAPPTASRPPAVPDREASVDRRLKLDRQVLSVPAPTSAPAPAAAPAPVEDVPLEERQVKRNEERATALAPADAGASTRVASAFSARFDASLIEVVSPTGRWRCRVATGRAVEASSDGGLTWAPVDGPAPADGVVGGVSPADGVCWMVGRGGLVILVRDGRATATGPREAGDLTTVQAEDASAALVRAADGRTWRTSDGGRTWSVVPTR